MRVVVFGKMMLDPDCFPVSCINNTAFYNLIFPSSAHLTREIAVVISALFLFQPLPLILGRGFTLGGTGIKRSCHHLNDTPGDVPVTGVGAWWTPLKMAGWDVLIAFPMPSINQVTPCRGAIILATAAWCHIWPILLLPFELSLPLFYNSVLTEECSSAFLWLTHPSLLLLMMKYGCQDANEPKLPPVTLFFFSLQTVTLE